MDLIEVRSVESTARCEGDDECTRPLRVNILTNDADIWLCPEHARQLADKIRELLGVSDPRT